MDHNRARHKDQLTFRTNFFGDSSASAAHAALMQAVFDVDPRAIEAHPDPAWMPFALFDPDGRCTAAVEAAVMTLVADAVPVSVTAIRRAGVDPAWRGQGLFRDVMVAALTWCETAAPGPTLLYTADHALYDRFGFRPLAQFKVAGGAPAPLARAASRIVDPRAEDALLRRLLATRTPVSARCALGGGASLFITHVRDAEDLTLAYAPDLDAIIVHEVEDDAILVVDVVAAAMPTLAQILAALPPRPRVTVLFPTDRLDWTGDYVAEETGLMIRGAAPAAMARPFMLPPTTEF